MATGAIDGLLESAAPLVPFIAALLYGAIGVAGIVKGRAVSRAHGAQTLMRYPWPSWRLQRRPVSARWVVRIGWLFLAASPFLPIVMFWKDVSPWRRYARAHSVCASLVTEKDFEGLGLIVRRGRLDDDGKRCTASFERRWNGRWASVVDVSVWPQTVASGSYQGRSPIQMQADNHARVATPMTRLPALGDDAFLVRDKGRAQLFIDAHGVPILIEVGESEAPDLTERLIDALPSRLDLVRP